MTHRPQKKARLADIAKKAGVSVMTVSYVLNGRKQGPDRISNDTRERVLAAATALSYVPNQTARDLRRKVTQRICLSIPRLGVPFYDIVAEQLQDSARAAGYHLIVNLSRDINEEEYLIRQLQGGLADALVLIVEESNEAKRSDYLHTLTEAGIAVLVFDNNIQPRQFDVVRTTELEACYDAVLWLIATGRKRIACLSLTNSRGKHHPRVQSYQKALEQAGRIFEDNLLKVGAEKRQLAYQATKELLSLVERPDAIFACTDVAALSAIKAVQDAGLSVPDDVAVLGVGNIIEGALFSPALSSVGPDAHDYSSAFLFLLSRLNADDVLPAREFTTSWSLKRRASA